MTQREARRARHIGLFTAALLAFVFAVEPGGAAEEESAAQLSESIREEFFGEPDWNRLARDKVSVEELIQQLLHGADPRSRAEAAMVFSDADRLPPAVVEALIQALGDSNRYVRVLCAMALMDCEGEAPGVVAAFVELLQDPYRGVRSVAVCALRNIGEPAQQAVPALLRFGEEADFDNRLAVHAAIPRITGKPGGHVKALMEVASGREVRPGPDSLPEDQRLERYRVDRSRAVASLGSIGPPACEAVPLLLELLHEDEELAWQAAYAMGRIKAMPAKVVPALIPFARPGTPERPEGRRLHARSIMALGSFPDQKEVIVPVLLDVLKEEDALAALILDSLRAIGAEGPQVVAALATVLDGEDDFAKLAAFELLGEMAQPPDEFLWRARAELATGHVIVREPAVVYLSRLAAFDDTCEEAVHGLVLASRDDYSSVQVIAVTALGKDYGCLQDEVIGALTDRLSDFFGARVVRAAVVSLGNLGPKAQSAIPSLESMELDRPQDGADPLRSLWHEELEPFEPLVEATLSKIRG